MRAQIPCAHAHNTKPGVHTRTALAPHRTHTHVHAHAHSRRTHSHSHRTRMHAPHARARASCDRCGTVLDGRKVTEEELRAHLAQCTDKKAHAAYAKRKRAVAEKAPHSRRNARAHACVTWIVSSWSQACATASVTVPGGERGGKAFQAGDCVVHRGMGIPCAPHHRCSTH